MPWFRLRRARRYTVSSKNSYVVCINMLDNSLIECTLTAESTGQECLENLAQRTELNELDYFGLRYLNKKLEFQWVELDKPLKRQLDKQSKTPLLYFGVMFYVADAHKIVDDNSRYQYYLQMKADVIDGKLPCSQEQAVLLASYSVQVEFGDHDYETHTPDYLKDYVLLPRKMTAEERTLSELTQHVAEAHVSLQGVPQEVAELQYLIEAQQLENYGREHHPAKDDVGKELLLGTSFVGIFVNYVQGSQPALYIKWADITGFSHSKRNFSIDTSLTEQTQHFVMDSPDMAKYVCKMCMLQHKFYRENPKARLDNMSKDEHVESGSVGAIPDIQQTAQLPRVPVERQITGESSHSSVYSSQTPSTSGVNHTTVVEPEYTNTQQMAQAVLSHDAGTAAQMENPYANVAHLQQVNQQQQQQPQQQLNAHAQPVMMPPPSTPTSRFRENALPAYRPTPDYETVMKRRMERMAQHQHNMERMNNATNLANIARAQVYNQPETMAYSQPEIGGNYIQPQSVYVNGFVEVDGISIPNLSYRPVDRTNSLIIQPTYSTPELSSQGLSTSQMSTSENMITEAIINQYRPPPPYRGNSNSTPDLAASQTPRSNLSNSPDLVSRRNINLSNAQLVDQSQFDQSVENLALDMPNLQLSQQMASNPRLTDESSRSSGHSGSFHKDFLYRTRSDPSQQPPVGTDAMLVPSSHANPQLAVFAGGAQMDPAAAAAANPMMLHHQHAQPTGITTTNVQQQQVVTAVTTNNIQQQMMQQSAANPTHLLQASQTKAIQPQMLQQSQSQTGANLPSAMVHYQLQQTQPQSQQQMQHQQQELLLQYQLQVQQRQQQQQLENQLIQQNLLHQTKPPPDYNEHMAQQQRQQQLQQHQMQHSAPTPQHQHPAVQTPQHKPQQPQQQTLHEQPARHSVHLQQPPLDLHDTPLLQKLQQEQPQITVTRDPDYVNLMSVTLGIDNPNYSPGASGSSPAGPAGGTSLSVLVPPAVSPSGSLQEENHYDTIDCLDTSKRSLHSGSVSGGGDASSVVSHSKSSSLDASSLSCNSSITEEEKAAKRLNMGPLKMAAMNGLSMSRASVLEVPNTESSAPRDERKKAFESKLEEGFVEFEHIPKKSGKGETSVATAPENQERNRFKDVHPYDHNRVKLTPRKDNKHGYINASHIKMNVKGEAWWYLAAQGPLPNTTLDFWQMLWEQNVQVVAMLTGVEEQGKSKCARYWPEDKGQKHKMKFGEYQVWKRFESVSGPYTTHTLVLRHIPSAKERTIFHIQYTDWPDHGCPEDIHGFLAYLDELQSVRRHLIMEKKEKDGASTPVLVHCSAGVGRSGVVVLADIMKICLEHNMEVDVPTVLRQLRAQRMYLVQTVSQYTFVYKTLVEYLNSARLI